MSPDTSASLTDRSITARTMSVLMAFDRDHPVLTVRELCHRSGLPPATTYRLVTKLVALGALERLERGAYCIGLRLWETVSGSPSAGLRQAALPHLLRLSVRTRAAALLGVRDAGGGETVFLEVLAGQEAGAGLPRSGDRLPAGGSAMGLLLQVRAGGGEAAAHTTDADTSAWPRHLVEQALHTGHVVAEGRLAEGVTEIVAAVRTPHGGTAAALGVAGGIARSQVPVTLHAVTAAAEALAGRTR